MNQTGLSDPKYIRARALVEQLVPDRAIGDVGIELAIAMGILIADNAPGGDGAFQAELARLVMIAAYRMRCAENLLSDCKGSA